MENKITLFVLLAMALIVSGCTGSSEILPTKSDDSNQNQQKQLTGKGLEVNSFSISDQTLSPGQTAEATLVLQNYHREEISLEEIKLYDMGLLEKEKEGCSPEESDLEAATENINPLIECKWIVEAPPEEEMGGFSQRSSSFSAEVSYNSAIENYRALDVEFKPLDQIESTSEKTISFSNGEVDVQASVESPIPFEQQKTLSYRIKRAGEGRIEDEVEFEFEPTEVFDLNSDESVDGLGNECPESKDIVLGSGLEFDCSISLDGSGAETRSLYFTTSYKYIKTPSMSITVVNE